MAILVAMIPRLLPTLTLAVLGATPLVAQTTPSEHDHLAGPPSMAVATDSVPLYRAALGPWQRRITTRAADAQAYFNQGVQFMFSFTMADAQRSFRESERRDSTCAMCAWGEAWSWGAYLNEPMPAANAPRAYAAIQRARTLVAGADETERELIEALAARYEPAHDSSRRKMLDTAYARAMGRVYDRHPNDLDVATLYAEALMLLEPRRGTWDIGRPEIQRIHAILLAALSRDITHPGACHLLIHAVETTPRSDLAEPCAELLGNEIPGASHINHMPSHIYNRLGRWGDAVRANIQAWHSDQRAAIGEGFAIYPTHNLHMLLFAASMDGQGAIAIQAGRDYAKLPGGGVFLQALAQVRFGRFEELLQDLPTAPRQPVQRGLWAFGRGYAHLRLGHPDSALSYAGLVDSLARAVPDSITFRGHTATRLLSITGGILRGETERRDGRLAEAIASFERAVTIEDSLIYDEPEPLDFSARDWLGAALIEANRPADAEGVYREALADHPHNGWALFGLAQTLAAQGRATDAAEVRAQFARAWPRADVWLRSSRP
jgi:tetratricopeptide (TPR) repeat protein